MVVLLHFDKPYAHMRHYVGYAESSNVPEKPFEAGASWLNGHASVEWLVARAWPDGGRGLQRKLRVETHLAQICPICRGEAAYKRAAAVKLSKKPEPDDLLRLLSESEQTGLCLHCPLPECVGTEKPGCPIRIEALRRWYGNAKGRRRLIASPGAG